MGTRREFLQNGLAVSITASSAIARGPGKARKYRACIIGATGRGDYGHGMHRVFDHRSDVTVVALSDPDPAARAKFAAEAKAATTYADYREMLEKEKPQLVSIGPRWPIDHLMYVLASADAGSHIYLEKPVAPSLEDADAMVAALDKKNLKCSVAHQMRLAPVIQTLKRQLDEGLLGELLELRGRGKEDHRAGGEDLMVLGTHVMDLMRFLAGGDPLWCSARITRDGSDITIADRRKAGEEIGAIAGDSVAATYAFPNGVMGYFASRKNAHADGGRFGIDLYCSKGIAKIRLGLDRVRAEVLRGASWMTGPEQWKPLQGFESPNDPRRGSSYLNALAVDDLIDAIEKNRAPDLSIEHARAGLEMTLAPYWAAFNAARVELPLRVRRHPLGAL